MEMTKKFRQRRILFASCALLLGLGTFPGLPYAFGQEKPAGSDAAPRTVTSRSPQTQSAEDRQSFENLVSLIRSGGGLWRASSTFKPGPLFLSFDARHSATFDLARPIGASRFAFVRVITKPGTDQQLSAFGRSTPFGPALVPSTTWNGSTRNWSTASNRSAAVATGAPNIPLISFTCPAGGTCWVGGASGVWSTSGNWSNGVPASGTNVLIDNGNANGQGASAVTLNISGAQAGNLTIDSDDSLSFNGNTTLTVNGGTISNAGKILVNGGGATNSQLLLGANTMLQGGGTVTMNTTTSGGGAAFIQGNTFTLTNVNNTIQGDGVIGNGSLTLVNQAAGTIDANSAGGSLALGLTLNGSGNVTNAGLLEATNSGVLVIQNTVNNAGGSITANGASAIVGVMGGDIQGGTLNTVASGTMETPGGSSATLDGSTHGALTLSTGSTYTSPLNTTTNILGTINNNGNFQVNGGSATNSYLELAGNTTLQGTGAGTVTLSTIASGGGAAFIQGNGFTLTNTNNTIQGDGIIGQGSLTLVNQATIDANTSAGIAGINLNGSGGVTNTSLLEATNGGTLTIQNGVNNSGGNITANGGTVSLMGASVAGGTLNTQSGGTMETPGGSSATLDGSSHGALTLSTGSTYTSPLSTTTNILGTINNNGNFQVNGGSATNTLLTLTGNTTLQGAGGGTVKLSTVISGGGAAFIQGNGFTLTNTNNTIQGDGIIGQGSLTLVNQSGGTINANSTGAGGQSLGLTLNGSGGVSNAGLLEATGTGVLAILNTVNNAAGTGGNITANGGTVAMENATVQGGTLTNNGGLLETPTSFGGTVLDGRSVIQGGQGTLTINGTYTSDFNSNTTLLGTIINKGNIQVNGGMATNSALLLGSASAPNLSLQGGGAVTLSSIISGGGAAFIQGNTFTLTNTNNTIQGDGVIGQGSLTLVNQAGGTINANSTGANGEGFGLQLNGSGGVTNAGLLEATNKGVLVINNTVNNVGGNITANGAGSQVQVLGGDIQGGTLNTLAGGAMNTPSANSATLDGSTHGALTLSTGSTYASPLNTTTNILGAINNKGTFQVNGGSATNSSLTLTGNTTLSGGGNVTLSSITSGGGAAFIVGNGFTLTNTNNTIQGDGIIGQGSLTLVNQAGGKIDANSTAGTMNTGLGLNGSGNVTNAGLLEATNNGLLAIQNTINNTGGNITANGAAAQVQVTGDIQGGTLNTLSGGTMQTPGGSSATLDGSTHGALTISTGSTYTSPLNSTTNILGTINNKGNIQVNGGSATNSFLTLAGNTTLSGGGKVTLSSVSSGGGAAFIQGNTFTLTNGSDTIQGDGFIGNGSLKVINQGTISANSAGGAMSTGLTLNGSGGLTNSGTLSVSAGDGMRVTGGPFTNFSGSTLTGGTYNVTGTLQIDELGSLGGEIVTNAANIILNTPASSFVDAAGKDALTNLNTNATGSSFTITGGRNFTTIGNFTNNGTLTIGASTSKFDVNGNLPNFSGTTLTGGTYNVTGTLQFNGANIVTNAANITLTGASSQIINQSSVNGLANFANNAPTATFGIAGSRNFTTASNFTNSGILTVGSGSKFDVNGNLTNFSGTTLTGGTYNLTGTLQFNGANIVTNAANITLTGASSQIINQLSANGLANFATNASTGKFAVAGGRKFTTVGAFTNNGTLTTTGSGSEFTAGGNFINTGSFTTTGGDSEVATISTASFTNNGTLTVGSASKFSTGGSLSNFSGTTLTGGTYNLTGMLQFNGANIVTNAANISLIGSGSKIVDQTGTTDGLRNFANNSATGSFSIAGGRNFTTAGSFTNAGTFSIGTGSTFILGALGNFTQTGGKITDDGTLSTSGTVSLTGGSLFGKGAVAGALLSSGTITPGDSSTTTGAFAVSKTYTQNSSGVLDIAIGGTTAGTKYDQLNITGAAILNGTLNLSLINGFIPTIGTTFEILNASSVSGTFSIVNGTHISPTEHFVVSCDTTDCDVTVASGAFILAQPKLAASSAYNAVLPTLRTHSGFGSQAMRSNLNGNFIRTANIADSSRIHIDASPHSSMLRRDVVQNDSLRLGPLRIREVGVFRTSIPPIHDFTKLQASFGAESSFLAIPSLRSVSDHLGRNAFSLNRNAAFRPIRSFIAGTTEHNLFRTGLNGLVRSGVSGAEAGLPRNARALRGNRIEYGFDLLSILQMRRGNNLGARSGPSLSNRFGYLMVTNSY